MSETKSFYNRPLIIHINTVRVNSIPIIKYSVKAVWSSFLNITRSDVPLCIKVTPLQNKLSVHPSVVKYIVHVNNTGALITKACRDSCQDLLYRAVFLNICITLRTEVSPQLRIFHQLQNYLLLLFPEISHDIVICLSFVLENVFIVIKGLFSLPVLNIWHLM